MTRGFEMSTAEGFVSLNIKKKICQVLSNHRLFLVKTGVSTLTQVSYLF